MRRRAPFYQGGERGAPPRERAPPPRSPIPEIVVTAKKKKRTLPANLYWMLGAFPLQQSESTLLTRTIPTAFERLMAQNVPTAFERLMAQPVRAKVMEEIIVTAPKPAVALSALQRLNIFATLSSILGTLGAETAREISQQQQDEAYRWLMAERHLRRPDSPLKTKPKPQPIPEIVVTGKRPAPSIQWARIPWLSFLFDMSLPFSAPKPKTQTEFKIDPPAVSKPTSTKAPASPGILPWSQPAPFGGPEFPTGNLTRLKEPGLPSPRTQIRPRTQTQAIRSGYCPPPPKCTKEKKPNRTECWRKLVKEHRRPELDKEYKWERIDCDTGRPIPKILQLLGV